MNRRRKQYYVNRLPMFYELNSKGENVVIQEKQGEFGDFLDEFFWEFHENPDEKYDELGSEYGVYRVEFVMKKLRLDKDAKKKKSSSA